MNQPCTDAGSWAPAAGLVVTESVSLLYVNTCIISQYVRSECKALLPKLNDSLDRAACILIDLHILSPTHALSGLLTCVERAFIIIVSNW